MVLYTHGVIERGSVQAVGKSLLHQEFQPKIQAARRLIFHSYTEWERERARSLSSRAPHRHPYTWL